MKKSNRVLANSGGGHMTIGQMLANDSGLFGADSHSNTPGVICLANEERFTQQFYSEPLTEYTVGYQDPNNIEATLEAIAPSVQVARRFEFKKAINAEQFLTEGDDIRAIGSDFKRAEFNGTSQQAKTLNKGLTVRIDMDETPDPDMEAERAAARLKVRLFRNELIRTVALLSAAAVNTAKTWNGTDGQDPDADISSILIAGGDDLGFQANRALYGATAWQKRFLTLRGATTSAIAATSTLTPQQLADLLGLDKVIVSRERFQSSTTAKSQIVGALAVTYMALDGASKDDPSNLKRFVSPVLGGGNIRVYRQQVGPKFIDITVEHYSSPIVTSTYGIQKLTIS